MAFKTAEWFRPGELDSLDSPEELRPGFDKVAATAARCRERELIKHRLYSEGAADLGNHLANCGLPMPLVCVCCGNDRAVETACRRRWCPACAWKLQAKRLDRYAGAVRLMARPAFLTLTVENSPDPDSIRQLRNAWSRMRRRKLIAEKVAGGVAAVEVTNQGNGWHPHLHAIIDCDWLSIHVPAPTWTDSQGVYDQKCEMAQAELSSVWAGVVKQSEAVVWISRMKDLTRLIYSLKYCVKGSDLVESPDAIAPMIRVLDKSRLVSAFGNLHGRTREMDADERPVMVCESCGHERSYLPVEIVERMARTDPTLHGLTVRPSQRDAGNYSQSQPA